MTDISVQYKTPQSPLGEILHLKIEKDKLISLTLKKIQKDDKKIRIIPIPVEVIQANIK